MSAVRPQLRGLLASQLKRQVVGCVLLSTVAVSYAKFGFKDGRLKRYEEFYKFVTVAVFVFL
jgi:Cytochrome c oxidase subunit VIc